MRARLAIAGLFVLLALAARAAPADAEPYPLRRSRAIELAAKHAPGAVDALAVLLTEKPDDPEVLLHLGLETSGNARQLDAGPARQTAMRRAREFLVHAQQAGATAPIIATALGEINADGTEKTARFSGKPELDRIFQQAEAAFGKRDFAGARQAYAAVLALDPRNYTATVYQGDAYFAEHDYAAALPWFEKAAALDPNEEKAFRYCGDTLLRLNRPDDALNQYLLAVVANPYSGYTWNALQNACKARFLKPWPAARQLPTATVRPGPKGPEIALPEKFTALNLGYATVRASWQKDHVPAGATYRQTLDEEVYALTELLKIFRELRAAAAPGAEIAGALNEAGPAMDELAEIERAGLLPSHVLFFRANADIAANYAAYRETNREKLRSYLLKFYLHLP